MDLSQRTEFCQRKFCFGIRTTYKVLIWCTTHPNAHTLTFCKHWIFIWCYFFPVSILKNAELGLQFKNKKDSAKKHFLLLEKRNMSVSFSNTKYLAFAFQRPSKSKLLFDSYSGKVQIKIIYASMDTIKTTIKLIKKL